MSPDALDTPIDREAPPVPESATALEAPAKLNLGLRVVGRRDDAYHLLESVFVPLDLCDDVTLHVAEGEGVEIAVAPGELGAPSPADVPADDRNLAVRAARAFVERASIDASIRIELSKRIPSAAGLGGGSSDAGAVLRGLSSVFPGALGAEALVDVALSLGADVPFFLDPRPALVTGIGERRRGLRGVPELAFVLANPRMPISTGEVFRRRAELDGAFTPEGQLEQALDAVSAAGWSHPGAKQAWAALLENDLAPAAEALCPAMRSLRNALDGAGALASGQSGSGATVFGVFASAEAAAEAREALSVNDSAWFRVAISRAAR